MTGIERKINNSEWIKTLKSGMDVCITNYHKRSEAIFSTMMGAAFALSAEDKDIDKSHEIICFFDKVRAITVEGHVLVSNTVYDQKGVPEGARIFSCAGELTEPTKELADLSCKMKFEKDIKNIDWSQVDISVVHRVIDILNPEFKRISDNHKRDNK